VHTFWVLWQTAPWAAFNFIYGYKLVRSSKELVIGFTVDKGM
jgi:hypothetical protein